MINGFDDVQQVSKEGVERTLASLNAFSTGIQTLATETADYSKRSFEEGSAHLERLFGSKSVESAAALQSDFLKASFEKAVGQANKFGELYVDIAKGVAKPFEGFVPSFPR